MRRRWGSKHTYQYVAPKIVSSGEAMLSDDLSQLGCESWHVKSFTVIWTIINSVLNDGARWSRCRLSLEQDNCFSCGKRCFPRICYQRCGAVGEHGEHSRQGLK